LRRNEPPLRASRVTSHCGKTAGLFAFRPRRRRSGLTGSTVDLCPRRRGDRINLRNASIDGGKATRIAAPLLPAFITNLNNKLVSIMNNIDALPATLAALNSLGARAVSVAKAIEKHRRQSGLSPQDDSALNRASLVLYELGTRIAEQKRVPIF
jgi:hypothetical protein